jgi:hypothetical protein
MSTGQQRVQFALIADLFLRVPGNHSLAKSTASLAADVAYTHSDAKFAKNVPTGSNKIHQLLPGCFLRRLAQVHCGLRAI